MVFTPEYPRKEFYGEKRNSESYAVGKGYGVCRAMPAAENECDGFAGFKRFDGLRALERHKVQVSQQRILEQGGYHLQEITPVRLQSTYRIS